MAVRTGLPQTVGRGLTKVLSPRWNFQHHLGVFLFYTIASLTCGGQKATTLTPIALSGGKPHITALMDAVVNCLTSSKTKEELNSCMSPLLIDREEFARTIHPQTREGRRHPQFSGYDRWDALMAPKRQDNVYQNWRLIHDEKIKVSVTGAYIPERAENLTFYNKTPLRFDRPGGYPEINRNILGVIACDNSACKLVSVFWD